MARVVGAIGTPHTPVFPMLAAQQGPESEIARHFARLAEQLAAMRPDVIVVFDTDHVNTFFLDNYPLLAIGVCDSFGGPNDGPPMVPDYSVPSAAGLAAHLRAATVAAGFDVGLVQGFTVDHSIMVPLHFLTPRMDVPVIPVFVSGHFKPLPAARRIHAFGAAIRAAVETWPDDLRVVAIGSGSFSLEVSGPRMQPGTTFGVPDPDWAARVIALMQADDPDRLLDEATSWQMLKAGNVGGELLDWIAMLGAFGRGTPSLLAPQVEFGHAYGAWQGD